MSADARKLLDVLKAELQFLEKGGYRRAQRQPWRPRFVFEDSPTCLNYDMGEQRHPCSECVLMQLVPPELRHDKFPCRHIPMTPEGDSLDLLYRSATQKEIENAVANWLRQTIEQLENERKTQGDVSRPTQGQANSARAAGAGTVKE